MDVEKLKTADFRRAFEAVLPDIAPHHDRVLRAHLACPGHATTWAQLAKDMGDPTYPNGSSVSLHYGKFAERVARTLGWTEKPRDLEGKEEAWWLWVLVRRAEPPLDSDGHTIFVLREPAFDALRQLGIAS